MATYQDHLYGPIYPELPSVAKYRRIAEPTMEDKRAHGEAVHKAILALQRSELMRVIASTGCPCVSGTFKADGDAILAHVKAFHKRAFAAAVEKDRRERKDEEIIEAYERAMAEKRKRQT